MDDLGVTMSSQRSKAPISLMAINRLFEDVDEVLVIELFQTIPLWVIIF